MGRHLIIDANNLIQRVIHVVKKDDLSIDEWRNRAYSIIFQSIIKMTKKFLADNVIMCFDSYSWREEIYNEYKKHHIAITDEIKLELKKISHMILQELMEFLKEETNMIVLVGDKIEADDFIARWTYLMRGSLETNIIVSNDADFKQLVFPGTDLYDPINNILYTSDGVYYQDNVKDVKHPTTNRHGEVWKIKYNQPKNTLTYLHNWDSNNKGIKNSVVFPITKYPKWEGVSVGELIGLNIPVKIIKIQGEIKGWEYEVDNMWLKFPIIKETNPLILYPMDRIRFIQHRETFNAKWELFLKCIRGDIRDNIKPSFLRVPETRLQKAFIDKEEYVKLINDRFKVGNIYKDVKPLYETNKKLIDLNEQPIEIKNKMDDIINQELEKSPKEIVELHYDNFAKNSAKLRDIKPNILPILSRSFKK